MSAFTSTKLIENYKYRIFIWEIWIELNPLIAPTVNKSLRNICLETVAVATWGGARQLLVPWTLWRRIRHHMTLTPFFLSLHPPLLLLFDTPSLPPSCLFTRTPSFFPIHPHPILPNNAPFPLLLVDAGLDCICSKSSFYRSNQRR